MGGEGVVSPGEGDDGHSFSRIALACFPDSPKAELQQKNTPVE
jgi:hypothetical protein